MAHQMFAWPPIFCLNFPFKFVCLTYAGLPNAFCKNTGHFINHTGSELVSSTEKTEQQLIFCPILADSLHFDVCV